MLDIAGAQRFHGHMCPGLAIGIRAAEIALAEVGGHSADEEIVAIVETDMCGVDAVQFLTGCTFGKGNLIHLDYGKNAFTFIRRSDGKAIRIVARPDAFGPPDPEWPALRARVFAGEATPEEKAQFYAGQAQRTQAILDAPLDRLFDVRPVEPRIPAKARIMASLTCEACGEAVMETRTRRFGGRTLCIPCFEAAERRW
ncbi:MAG: FmdE family protein [Anaerolineae bacterium]|nr:FmdE family protein [Anaerolineae bacterium]